MGKLGGGEEEEEGRRGETGEEVVLGKRRKIRGKKCCRSFNEVVVKFWGSCMKLWRSFGDKN